MGFRKISCLCVVCTVKSSVFPRKLPLLYTVEWGRGLQMCWPKARTRSNQHCPQEARAPASHGPNHSLEEMGNPA